MPTADRLAVDRLAVDLLARTGHGRVATSMRALPFLTFARHIVVDGRVLLRMPGSWGHHRACVGGVVAYGTDNLSVAGPGESLWSAQIVGECTAYDPTPAEIARFGPAPRRVDGEPYEPVYLSIDPQFGTVHSIDDGLESHFEHIP
ncbi:pyridoxamine 5'-phosphate oxidase family protein [Streptomyces sp. YU58]|uniref:pyridoxamine 5'-phosphate oxidase family protein n=1 Tax=Streptomyces sp. SX92 TaxID=3158972 RepID=UPI0027B9F438|nr:pyridoxamine 5'-phosphate oxidase family protein [Streptomyces coralus]WLW53643.1 pyridoxamine 5'-phosphate oxidase family protein [Streptomyces coralus]